MDRKLRNTIIFGIIIVSLSIFIYLVIRPNQKTEFDACYDKCTNNGSAQDKHGTCMILCGRHYPTN